MQNAIASGFFGLCLSVLALAGCSAPASRAPGAPPLTADEQKIGEVVRKYLLANPEVLDEVAVMRARQLAEGDGRDFAIGPANAPVTVVEFMDYGCSACHAAMDWVIQAQKKHGDKVRVVFVDLPVVTRFSEEAARAALAAKAQDKYFTLHQAMMRFQGPLTTDVINDIARKAGIDVARMRRDMASADISQHINANRDRARKLGIEGTPAFKINGVAVPGFSPSELDRTVEEQLKAAGA